MLIRMLILLSFVLAVNLVTGIFARDVDSSITDRLYKRDVPKEDANPRSSGKEHDDSHTARAAANINTSEEKIENASAQAARRRASFHQHDYGKRNPSLSSRRHAIRSKDVAGDDTDVLQAAESENVALASVKQTKSTSEIADERSQLDLNVTETGEKGEGASGVVRDVAANRTTRKRHPTRPTIVDPASQPPLPMAAALTMSDSLYNHFRPLEKDLPEDDILPFLAFGKKLVQGVKTPVPKVQPTSTSSTNAIDAITRRTVHAVISASEIPKVGELQSPREDEIEENMDVSIVKTVIEKNKVNRSKASSAFLRTIGGLYRRTEPTSVAGTLSPASSDSAMAESFKKSTPTNGTNTRVEESSTTTMWPRTTSASPVALEVSFGTETTPQAEAAVTMTPSSTNTTRPSPADVPQLGTSTSSTSPSTPILHPDPSSVGENTTSATVVNRIAGFRNGSSYSIVNRRRLSTYAYSAPRNSPIKRLKVLNNATQDQRPIVEKERASQDSSENETSVNYRQYKPIVRSNPLSKLKSVTESVQDTKGEASNPLFKNRRPSTRPFVTRNGTAPGTSAILLTSAPKLKAPLSRPSYSKRPTSTDTTQENSSSVQVSSSQKLAEPARNPTEPVAQGTRSSVAQVLSQLPRIRHKQLIPSVRQQEAEDDLVQVGSEAESQKVAVEHPNPLPLTLEPDPKDVAAAAYATSSISPPTTKILSTAVVTSVSIKGSGPVGVTEPPSPEVTLIPPKDLKEVGEDHRLTDNQQQTDSEQTATSPGTIDKTFRQDPPVVQQDTITQTSSINASFVAGPLNGDLSTRNNTGPEDIPFVNTSVAYSTSYSSNVVRNFVNEGRTGQQISQSLSPSLETQPGQLEDAAHQNDSDSQKAQLSNQEEHKEESSEPRRQHEATQHHPTGHTTESSSQQPESDVTPERSNKSSTVTADVNRSQSVWDTTALPPRAQESLPTASPAPPATGQRTSAYTEAPARDGTPTAAKLPPAEEALTPAPLPTEEQVVQKTVLPTTAKTEPKTALPQGVWTATEAAAPLGSSQAVLPTAVQIPSETPRAVIPTFKPTSLSDKFDLPIVKLYNATSLAGLILDGARTEGATTRPPPTTSVAMPKGNGTVVEDARANGTLGAGWPDERQVASGVAQGAAIAIYVLSVLGIVPLMIAIALAAKYLLVRRRKLLDDADAYSEISSRRGGETDSGVGSPLPGAKLPQVGWEQERESVAVDPRWEFPRSKLRLQTVLGQGNFGQVLRAEADDLRGHAGTTRLVAVKTVKDGAAERDRDDLVRELRILQALGSHPNVVTLLGCCTEAEPLLLIMEYVMYGKMLAFLRDRRTRQHYYNFSEDSDALTSRDLTVFAYCVARGMEFLVSKGIIHRDLAARNVLVDHNKLCKIADFGMSRTVRELGEVYEQRHTKGALPIRWMAPESLQYRIFTHKSDVWSFGILMWEIVTLGSTPYQSTSAREVMRRVRDGYRLERPPHCRPELFRVASRCWASDPAKRPDFTELRQELGALLDDSSHGGGYVDLESFAESKYATRQHGHDTAVAAASRCGPSPGSDEAIHM